MDASEAERWDLLLRHRDAVVSIVRRKVRNAAEAEDCVHDAILRLVRRSDLDPERVHSLLTKVAVGLAIDGYRSTQSRDRAVTRLAGGAVSEAISPEDVLADQEEVERIMALVDALPRRERQVMHLRIARWGVREAARLLRLSGKSVEGAITRARQRLRDGLQTVLAWLAARRRGAGTPGDTAAALGIAALVFTVPLLHGLFGPPPGQRPGGGQAPGAAAASPPWSEAGAPGTAAGTAPDGPGSEGRGGDRGGRGGSGAPPDPGHRGDQNVAFPIEVDAPPQASSPPILTGFVGVSGLPPDISTDPNVVIGGLEHCESGAEQQLQQGIDTARSIC